MSEANNNRELEERPDGSLILVIGNSRSGKTSFAVEQMGKASRALVWDMQGQIGASDSRFYCLESLPEVREKMEAHMTSAARIAYMHSTDKGEFSAFCKMAYAWAIAEPCLLFCEELAMVTEASRAVPGWSKCTMAALKYGMDMIACTQRPQRVDKDTLDNATHLVLFRQGDEARKALLSLGIPADKIPSEKHKYYVRDPEGKWTGPHTTKPL